MRCVDNIYADIHLVCVVIVECAGLAVQTVRQFGELLQMVVIQVDAVPEGAEVGGGAVLAQVQPLRRRGRHHLLHPHAPARPRGAVAEVEGVVLAVQEAAQRDLDVLVGRGRALVATSAAPRGHHLRVLLLVAEAVRVLVPAAGDGGAEVGAAAGVRVAGGVAHAAAGELSRQPAPRDGGGGRGKGRGLGTLHGAVALQRKTTCPDHLELPVAAPARAGGVAGGAAQPLDQVLDRAVNEISRCFTISGEVILKALVASG